MQIAEHDIKDLQEELRQEAAQREAAQAELEAATNSKNELQQNVASLQRDVHFLE